MEPTTRFGSFAGTRDLDLDLYSVAVVLGCLERIDALEHELRSLQARLPNLNRQDP